jgi:hypothetical protein
VKPSLDWCGALQHRQPRTRHIFDGDGVALCLATGVYPLPMGVTAPICLDCVRIALALSEADPN